MKFRGTLLLVTLAIGLILFAYFYEIRGGRKREEAKEKAQKVLSVKDNAISSIEIVRPGKETLKVEKSKEGAWMITSPLKARADEGAVGGLTWQLADLNFTQVASEAPSDLGPFGLITPEISLTFEAEGNKKTLLFGADTPIGMDAYLQVKGEKRVLVISRSAKSAFDKQVVDIRDKRVLVFDQAELVAMELSTGEKKIAFERRDDDWKMTAPMKTDASDERVQGLLDELSTLEAQEFIPEVAATAKPLGSPSLQITLILGEKERSSRKISFRPDNKNSATAIAHPESDPWFYKVSASIITDANRPADYFRERRVLQFDRFNLSEMVIQNSPKAKPIKLTKDDKGDWYLTEPAGAKGKVVASKVYEFIDSLENLKAEDFVDTVPPNSETGLDNPPAVILYGKGENEKSKKELARLVLGKKKDSRRYARGNGPQVFLVSGVFLLPKGPETFTEVGSPPEPVSMSPESP